MWTRHKELSLNTAQVANQPTKGLIREGDLRQAQVDVPSSVQPFLRVTASLCSLTDSIYKVVQI